MDASTTSPNPAGPSGGSGEPSASVPTKVDCRLLELALRENWDIPPATIAATIAGLTAVITEPENLRKRPRLWLRCVESLQALSRKNLASVETAIRARIAEGPADQDTLVELALSLRDRMKGAAP
jgi:hypothetical protein